MKRQTAQQKILEWNFLNEALHKLANVLDRRQLRRILSNHKRKLNEFGIKVEGINSDQAAA